MRKVAVVIVTFNPDLILLKKSISNLKSFYIFISDNGSNNIDGIKKIIKDVPNTNLVLNKSNVGIATAQNRSLLRIIRSKEINFVLFLDQDSLITENSVKKLHSDFLETNDKNLAILSAISSNQLDKGHGIINVNECISSGMLVSIAAIKEVGLMMDSLFIDMVDYEWCWRFIKKGWHVAVDYNVQFNHQIGNHKIVLKRIEIAPFRLYYVFRNTIFLIRNNKTINRRQTHFWINYLLKLFVFNVIFCSDRIKRFEFIKKGVVDAIKGKLGKLT